MLQPMEDPTSEQAKEAAPGSEPILGKAPGRTCDPMESGARARADFLAGLMTPWETHAGAVHS